jgi:hypothetical protein
VVGYATEIRKNLFVIDVNHLSINIGKVKTDSQITCFVLFSSILFVHYQKILNMIIDLELLLCFFCRRTHVL